jgi:hypothetical protein
LIELARRPSMLACLLFEKSITSTSLAQIQRDVEMPNKRQSMIYQSKTQLNFPIKLSKRSRYAATGRDFRLCKKLHCLPML